jgi:cytoskeleton protein RodZ
MSETETQREQQEHAASLAGTSAAAAGAMLREAREAAGVHIAAMAVSLKVPVKKLEALEAGRLDLLPDAVFARGLAASICRGLKLDPQPVLELLPQNASARNTSVVPPAINAPFNAASGDTGSRAQVKMSPTAIAVLVLLLGALVIYFLPVSHKQTASDGSASEPVVATQPPVENPAPGAPVAVGAEPVPGAAQPVTSPPAATTALATPAPAASAAAAPGAAVAGANDPSQLLVFVARAESWVQVTDAKGVTPVRKTLQAGETVTAGGALPLAVVVGRIEAVDVQVRGKTMDLTPIAKNNVARFEVKQ